MVDSASDRLIGEAGNRDRSRERRDVPARTVSSYLAGVVLDAARAAGAEERQIVRLLGWDTSVLLDRSARIPTTDVSRLWELLRRLLGPEAGIIAADRAEQGRLYVWDYLIGNAPTLAEGLRDAARFHTTICDPEVGFDVVEDGSLLTARIWDMPHRESAGALSKEFAIAVILRRARESFGETSVPVRVDFSHPAPTDRRYLVRALGTGNIHFGQGRDAITFLGAGAFARPRMNDPVLQTILRSQAQAVLDAIGGDPAWLEAFRAVLRGVLSDHGGAGVRLDEVAGALRISDRTLQRRLAEHATTWSAELDTVRRDVAIALLGDPAESVQSIALRLGYRDRRVLARAFRRWTGQSPEAFRRALSN